MKTLTKAVVFMALLTAGCAKSTGVRPTLLVVGDSTSINYHRFLSEYLVNNYKVIRPDENCRNSYYTANHITEWLSEASSAPSVIVWNNGIWDSANIGFVPGGEVLSSMRTSDAEYEANLRASAAIMLATGAKVYFVTTTRISSSSPDYDYTRVATVNAIATTVMNDLGIQIITLGDASQSMESYKVDPLHYGEEGSKILADYIASDIKE